MTFLVKSFYRLGMLSPFSYRWHKVYVPRVRSENAPAFNRIIRWPLANLWTET